MTKIINFKEKQPVKETERVQQSAISKILGYTEEFLEEKRIEEEKSDIFEKADEIGLKVV